MKTFKDFISEAVSTQDIHNVSILIQKYLSKRVGAEFFRMPGLENFISSGKTFTGMRFFYKEKSSVRFNWTGKSLNQNELDSITIWKDSNNKFDGCDPTGLKYLSITALIPAARHWSLIICSQKYLVLPYGLTGEIMSVSSIGILVGLPYTVAEDEKIIFLMLFFFITLSKVIVELILFS